MPRSKTARQAEKAWHFYRDSEAPGVRRASLGIEPDYTDTDLALGLAWAAVAKWGAGYLRFDGQDPQAVLEAFCLQALRLGFEITHVHQGKGEASWRFRVSHLVAPAIVQLGLDLAA